MRQKRDDTPGGDVRFPGDAGRARTGYGTDPWAITTDPGDIVFDGFCGTGMTGVAAQLCGDRQAVEELRYFMDKEGFIYDKPPLPLAGEGMRMRFPSPGWAYAGLCWWISPSQPPSACG